MKALFNVPNTFGFGGFVPQQPPGPKPSGGNAAFTPVFAVLVATEVKGFAVNIVRDAFVGELVLFEGKVVHASSTKVDVARSNNHNILFVRLV